MRWRSAPERDYLIGVDLAQGGADWTAICVLERTEPLDGRPAEYGVIELKRWRSEEPGRIPERVGAMLWQLDLRQQQREFELTGIGSRAQASVRIVVDQTGVGPFGLDSLRQAGLDPTGIVIHGGDAVTHPDAHTYRVPKRDLVGVINVLLHSGRLRVESSLLLATVLKAELENFRVTITLSGHDVYEAGPAEEWREGKHDDLVLAVGIAAWLGESHPLPRLDPAIAAAWADLPRR